MFSLVDIVGYSDSDSLVSPVLRFAENAIIGHFHSLEELVGFYGDIVGPSSDSIGFLSFTEVHHLLWVCQHSIYAYHVFFKSFLLLVEVDRSITTDSHSIDLHSILSLLLTDYNLLEDELSYQRANVLIEFVIHHV